MRNTRPATHRFFPFLAIAAGALILGAALHALAPWGSAAADEKAADEKAADEKVADEKVADETDAAITQAKSLSLAFRSAAEKTLPTVVKIKTRTRLRTSGGMPRNHSFRGTPFEEFFGDEFDLDARPRAPLQSGVGSGVIIDPSGVILTNNHVVEGSDEIIVQLPDGRELKATDVKADKQTDMALLKIDAGSPLPAARLGDSDKLEIGDWVIAIGSPFELEQTVSAGIISGKGRELGAVRRANLLQTDAAINPGNSGGPLVNLDGEVIGINTAIASNNGGYQGIGFAVPINVAKWVIAQLQESGAVERAYLGVGIGEVTPALGEKLGVAPRGGVLVTEVFPDTPASKAGFQEADVIVAFAGHPVRTPRQLQELVERSPAGTGQPISVIRGGKRQTLQCVVRPMPNQFGQAELPDLTPGGRNSDQGHRNATLGLSVADLSAEAAQRLEMDPKSGVLVTQVDRDGIGADLGIANGMVILRVGDQPVRSVDEFKAAMKGETLTEGILLLLRTSQGNRMVVVRES
ncbi:MAG: Do family serine endopeptidase [Planctomycetes bacterium]|nr:Do family serine endopeptidase [Planctomycetota bacterium]